MLNVLFLSACLLAPSQTGGAPAKPVAKPKPDVSQPADQARELEFRYLLLVDQYTQSETEFKEQVRLLLSFPEQRKELFTKHPVKQYWARFEELAGSGSAPASLWLIAHVDKMFADRAEIVQRITACLRVLIDEHASDSCGMEIVTSISLQRYWLGADLVERLLNDFLRKTKNREYAAGALVSVVKTLSLEDDLAKASAERMEQATDRILHEFSDTQASKQFLEGIAAKQAGMMSGDLARDFIGKDVDGVEIRLFAQRGKVVLLNFWGFWNPQSSSMIPRLRELLGRHAADPFVVLGVSSDADPERFRELSKQNAVSWPSAWDGGRSGPIAETYGVRVLPTLFLIDSKGVIRRAWVGVQAGKSFDEQIEGALALLLGDAK